MTWSNADALCHKQPSKCYFLKLNERLSMIHYIAANSFNLISLKQINNKWNRLKYNKDEALNALNLIETATEASSNAIWSSSSVFVYKFYLVLNPAVP